MEAIQFDMREVLKNHLLGRLVLLEFAENPLYVRSHMGGGNLYADCLQHKARYCPERKLWYIHNGKFWEPDPGALQAMELCKALAEALAHAAVGFFQGEQSAKWYKYADRWQNRSYRETILKDAQSVHPVRAGEFDRDPFLLNCDNGTLDLRDGSFHKHDPDDLLSTICGTEYHPDAKSELWEKTVSEVMRGDEGLIQYLQKALGYGLTGDTSEECFFLLYGPTTRNGKGTVMETYMKVLGGYGRAARPETIALRPNFNASGPSEDIAKLCGARAVNISEPDRQLVMSSAVVKAMTGSDTLTARFLNENSFEFKPQFKLFINTNHLPKTNDATIFTSGRAKVLPFDRHFSELEQDKTLKRRLLEELPGVLNWCIQGLQMRQEQGFQEPQAVTLATAQYRHDCDKLARFVEEVLVEDDEGEVGTEDLYLEYKKWCIREGLHMESRTTFRRSLDLVGTVKRKRLKGAARDANKTTVLCGYRM